jgi:hypothetical protein
VETAELRPLSLGELLDRTFTLYRNHFWLFVGIMAIPAALGVPVSYIFSRLYLSSFTDPNLFASPTPQFGRIWAFLGIAAAISIVASILYSIVAAAVTVAVSEAYLGRSSTVVASYKSALGKVWRLLAVALNVIIRLIGIAIAVSVVLGVAGAILIVGATAAVSAVAGAARPAAAIFIVVLVVAVYGAIIAAMVYLALRYAVAIPALMLEDLGVLASIRRSVQLTKGRRGQVFVALLLAFVISAVGSIVFYIPFSIATMISMAKSHTVPAWLGLMTSVFSAVGRSLTGPIFLIVLVLCYYDTRIRKEAFDLQFMMQSLDRAAPPPAASAGSVPSA